MGRNKAQKADVEAASGKKKQDDGEARAAEAAATAVTQDLASQQSSSSEGEVVEKSAALRLMQLCVKYTDEVVDRVRAASDEEVRAAAAALREQRFDHLLLSDEGLELHREAASQAAHQVLCWLDLRAARLRREAVDAADAVAALNPDAVEDAPPAIATVNVQPAQAVQAVEVAIVAAAAADEDAVQDAIVAASAASTIVAPTAADEDGVKDAAAASTQGAWKQGPPKTADANPTTTEMMAIPRPVAAAIALHVGQAVEQWRLVPKLPKERSAINPAVVYATVLKEDFVLASPAVLSEENFRRTALLYCSSCVLVSFAVEEAGNSYNRKFAFFFGIDVNMRRGPVDQRTVVAEAVVRRIVVEGIDAEAAEDRTTYVLQGTRALMSKWAPLAVIRARIGRDNDDYVEAVGVPAS